MAPMATASTITTNCVGLQTAFDNSDPNDDNPDSDDNQSGEPRIDSLPPAVYITNIRVAPNPPPKRSPITFTASFYNTNRESVGMNWRIIF